MQAMFKGHRNGVTSLAFFPDGRSLVSASFDYSVRVWSIRSGSSKVLPATGSPSVFKCFSFSPNGCYIAAGNVDNSLWIWNLRTHGLVAKWPGHTESALHTEFTPDGKGLITGGSDNTVKYWDVSSLGNRQRPSTRMVLNEEQGFPLVWSFRGDSVRCILLYAPRLTEKPSYPRIFVIPLRCSLITPNGL